MTGSAKETTNLYGPLLRFVLFVSLAIVLGRLVLSDPSLLIVDLPEQGIALTLPDSLEGWRVKTGADAQILTAATRLSLATLEIVDTAVPADGDLRAHTSARIRAVQANASDLILWEEGAERYGNMTYHAAKWTAGANLGPLPLTVSYWSLDHYVLHNGTYLRMTLRYPHFMWRYFRPDRWMIGGGLRLEEGKP